MKLRKHNINNIFIIIFYFKIFLNSLIFYLKGFILLRLLWKITKAPIFKISWQDLTTCGAWEL
jgi:hypothetical protein